MRSLLKQNLRDIACLLAPFFLLFLIGRMALLALYPHDFEGLDLAARIRAMALGAWHFDTSITLIAMGLPLWLHLLAFGWTRSVVWRRFLLGWSTFALIVFAFAEVADIAYFGFVHRHVGHELMAALRSDPDLVRAIALDSYGWLLAAFGLGATAVAAAAVWLGKRIRPSEPLQPPSWRLRLPLAVVALGLIVLGIRGSAVSKPIQPVYAFEDAGMAAGYLELNGAFCAAHALHGAPALEAHFMDDARAVNILRNALRSPREHFVDARHPLLRSRQVANRPRPRPNIVVILLESWDALHVDIARQLEGMKPYGVTPNFDRLARQGMYLANFYANGQRSIDAITALLTGIPPQPGQPYLGEGLELNRFTWLGRMAKRHGYATVMMQGSKRASFYLDKIAPLAGFDAYLGAEDLIPTLHPNVPKPTWSGWDLDLMETAHRRFVAMPKPFLGFVFTVSTHTPFELPDPKWQTFPPDSEEHKLLNAMRYSDWVLGRFFREARAAGYGRNTIFVLLGDHYSGLGHPRNLRDQHHIPALILGPGIRPGVVQEPASQEDLIPTLMDLAGWPGRHATLGQSIVEPGLKRGVFLRRDNLVGRVERAGFLMHDLRHAVYWHGNPQARQGLEQRLLATVQTLNRALRTNTLLPAGSP